MIRALPLISILLLSACAGGNGGGSGSGSGDDGWSIGGGNGDNIDANVEMPAGEPDQTITGDLSDGSTIDLGWAETSYCWPATENVNFNGSHVFYEFTQATDTDLVFRVVPDSGVDVSVYYIQSDGSYQTPPSVSSPWECDGQYDQSGDNNPGQAEVLYAIRNNEYKVTVGVAGANGTTSGAYTLEVYEVYGQPFDQE